MRRIVPLLLCAGAALASAPAPAHAEDACVVVGAAGAVNAAVGRCVPTPFTTNCFTETVVITGVQLVYVQVCVP